MSNAIPTGFTGAAGLARVPDELRCHDRWVCWRRETRDGKPTKVPYNPATGKRASSTDPKDWFSFDAAVGAAGEGGYDGVGFVFARGEGFCGIDIDGCIDEQGRVSDGAREIIDALGSYAEASPSGTGVKIFLLGVKPAAAKCKRGGVPGFKAIEIYEHGRYFTVTGQHLAGTPLTVEDGQAALDALCARFWAAGPTTPRAVASAAQGASGAAALDDDRLLDLARGAANGAKFKALFDEGDTSGYDGDDSRADLALCSILMFWTNGDAERVDRLFRQSKLYRPKWERDDYRASTLAVAAQGIVMKTKTASGGRVPPATPGTVATAPEDDDGAPFRPLPTTFALTDLGNAERLAALRRDAIRYCVSTGRWYEWDGQRWSDEDQGAPYRHAGAVVRGTLVSATGIEELEPRAAMAKWSIRSEGRQRLDAMVALAKTREELIVRVPDLDHDRFAFNCLNGTIDLRTGQIRKARPDDLITKVGAVWHDPGADCPRFMTFLDRIFAGDGATIAFVQRLLGMCLTGDIQEQYLPIFQGQGANGKSVLCELMMSLVGGYATIAPASLLTANGRDEHPTEIADLLGRRLVIASESEEGAELKLQQVKRLTGDAKLKGRFMREDFFEFDRTHKIIMVTNNRPLVREDTEAVWRRLRLVPFNVVIPEGERDLSLLPKLIEEGSGVLNWLIQGCLEWQGQGLGQPQAVAEATREYRKTQDDPAQFLEECFERQGDASESGAAWSVPWATIREAYSSWCRESGASPLQDRKLGAALDRLGVMSSTQRVDGKPTKVRIGVRRR